LLHPYRLQIRVIGEPAQPHKVILENFLAASVAALEKAQARAQK